MARCKQDGQDFKQALLQMRTTPISKDLSSPFEILHGHTGRTVNGQAEHKPIDYTQIRDSLMERQTKMTNHYNRRHGAKELSPLHEQQNILIQHRDGNWEPATVTQVGPEPRSYLCRTISGKVFRRNRKHIQVTGMPDNTVSCTKTNVASKTAENTPSSSQTTTGEHPTVYYRKTTSKQARRGKTVTWSNTVEIIQDAETSYNSATQLLQLSEPAQLHSAHPGATETAENIAVDLPVAVIPPQEDNQSHLSDSEREGKAEESLLTPDVQVTGVVSQTLENRPSAVEHQPDDQQDHQQPRRSRRKVKKICYKPHEQRKSRAKQMSQAK